MMKGKTGKAGRIISVVMTFVMIFAMMAGTGITASAEESKPISRKYGDFIFSKISNPSTGSKQADGINTNDTTGYSANRLNSYAWAVISRGDSIYIGTNRTLFGSALNGVAEVVRQQNPDITDEELGKFVSLISCGDVPVNLEDKDYIPQIIRFDIKKGSTEVIYQPATAKGEDGRLYYTDKNGAIIPAADVASETASFRSVVEFKGKLYFGTLGINMLQLVRVDEKDNADVVFQTTGMYSSLRAGCTYNDGTGETVYYGGQDAANKTWLKYRQDHPGEAVPLPIVIRYLDPRTAGTGQENWDGLVADFSDFGEYSFARVYASGGGNVWDLCTYNGKLYLILAYDGGWAMFRGEKGGKSPNKYGWTWTEVVGNNGRYPLAMDAEIAGLNKKYSEEYGCSRYGSSLNGIGLLESAATPYVYKGKMYIGTFDNATMLQAQTMFKLLAKLKAMKTVKETGDFGPSLKEIFAPFYEALSHQQHVWVMDDKETITPVESANGLLSGTTNDYVWRFIEYDGKLYTGTFDSSTAYNPYLGCRPESFASMLEEHRSEMPEYLQQLMDGNFADKLKAALRKKGFRLNGNEVPGSGSAGNAEDVAELKDAAVKASSGAEEFIGGDGNVEDLLDAMTELEDAYAEFRKNEKQFNNPKMLSSGEEEDPSSQISGEAQDMIEWLLKFLDVEGLKYWVKARRLIQKAEGGFDLFVTEDGNNWSKVLGDGLKDPYNYGARTFTVCNDELYLGTANPFYGSQLWKVTDKFPPSSAVTKPAAVKDLTYKGKAQDLVTPGTAEGGTMMYALGKASGAAPETGWTTSVPKAVNAGDYFVYWKVKGDAEHKDKKGDCIKVTVKKAQASITVKKTSKKYRAKSLKKKAKKFSIKASVNSKGKLSYKVVKYKNKASKKRLKLNKKTGKITVRKGTPKGVYKVKIKVTAKATKNYKSKSVTKTIKVKVR